MSRRRAALAAGTLALALVSAGAVAAAAPAAGATCTTTLEGVGWSAVYTGVAPDGTKLGPANLDKVTVPGGTVTVKVRITALPTGSSCVNLTLATYRAATTTFEQGQYQTLFAFQTVNGVTVGSTATLVVKVPPRAGTPGPGCTNTHTLLQNGNGANVPGPYDTTCDGTPSGNGQGVGAALGKACAGCVGNADNKNPPGQLPGPQDHNAGYECDTNQGIAKGNPAHSGCTSGTYWQIDLATGGVLPYLGTPVGGGETLYYSFGLPADQQRLLAAANG